MSYPPLPTLFEGPTVVEITELNEEDKAFVTMLLLLFLREYCERRERGERAIRHVTVVEEAHNVLENLPARGPSEVGTQGREVAVRMLCTMLAEVRSYGESLFIADQSPRKLAPDAMRNTNLHLIHRLADGEDRDAVANSLIMTPEQRDFLAKLPQGHAAAFFNPLQWSTFIRVRPYPTRAGDDWPPLGTGYAIMSDRALRLQGLQATVSQATQSGQVCFPGLCATCNKPCQYSSDLFPAVLKQHEAILAALDEEAWRGDDELAVIARLGLYVSIILPKDGRLDQVTQEHRAWCCGILLLSIELRYQIRYLEMDGTYLRVKPAAREAFFTAFHNANRDSAPAK